MKCVIYTDCESDRQKLVTAIRTRMLNQKMELHETLRSMMVSLGKERFRLAAAIFSITPPTLESLLSYRDLLVDLPVILILSEMDDITLTIAHRFYPRFVTRNDGTFDVVAAVVDKMIRRAGLATAGGNRDTDIRK